MAKIEESEDELVNEIKAKIEELRDAEVAKIEAERELIDPQPEEGFPEIDRESLKIRLPDEILYKLLKLALIENDCRNRGYILDGYPRTYKNACEVFLQKIKKFDEEGNEVEEDEPELEEGEEKSYDNYEPNKAIFPSSIVVLKGEDEFLINRVKGLEQSQIEGTHYNYEDMVRRLAAYRSANNSIIAEPSVQQFFSERGVERMHSVSCSEHTEKEMKGLRIYIERVIIH